MADPKKPKQLSEENVLVEFTSTGNLYVDPAYTSAETTPATSITGEALVFGENTLTDFTVNNNSSPALNPEDGHATFVSNLKRGTARGAGHDFFFSFNRNKQLNDVYITNSEGGDFSASPRVADTYVADSDGALNVYIENSVFGGNLMGFGSQSKQDQSFTGNYEFTFKNSRTQWFCITYGTGYGQGEGGPDNVRFGTVYGNIDLLVDGSTVTNNGVILAGGIHPGDEAEKAYLRAYIKDSLFQGEFGVIKTGVENTSDIYSKPRYKSEVDVDLTIEGSTFTNVFLMFPNVATNTNTKNGDITTTGDVNFKATNTRFSGLNMGAGLGGTGWNRTGWIKGNINFDISGSSNSSRTFIHKGFIGTAEEHNTVTGTLANSVFGDFTGYDTRENNYIYADTSITITASTIGNFTLYNTVNSNGNVTPTADRVFGAQSLTLAGVTAGNVAGNGPAAGQADATFTLTVNASEFATKTGAITQWASLTIDAGADFQAASISNVSLVSMTKGAEVSVGQFSGVATLAITGEYTAVSNTLVSGLTSFTAGESIQKVTLNGEELQYGFLPGQYSLMGDKLVLHRGETVLVNSSFTDGETVTLDDKNYIGYSSVAKAQEAVSADAYILTLVPNDGSSEVEEDIVTKGYGVVVQGSETPVDMKENNFIIGETGVLNEGATIIIDGLTNVGAVSFGNLNSVYVSANNVAAKTIDLRGAAIGDADITFSGLEVEELYLPTTNSIVGTMNLGSGSIATFYNSAEGDGKLAVNLGKVNVGTLYSEGKSVNVGQATVGTYYAGIKDGGNVDAIDFTAGNSTKVENLILGGAEAANTIGSVTAKLASSGIANVKVGGDNDTISGDVNVEIGGNAVGIDSPANGTFTGIVYGTNISGTLDGGTDKTTGSSNLKVAGHSKVNAISGFDKIDVTGGTLNVGSIEGNAAITNRRTIYATSSLSAGSVKNSGVISTKEGLSVATTFENSGYVIADSITAGGTFTNSNKIEVNSITVGGFLTNSGVIYALNGENGGISLGGADLTNTGTIYASSLEGVEAITTSSLFVAESVSIVGDLTVTANADVAFQSGLSFSGNVKIDATSTLSVGGDSFDGTSITIDVDGGLIGSNEVVRANGGLDDGWTITLSGANKGDYGFTKSATSIVVYSVGELFVNSKFSADSDCFVDGHKLIYGKNAFATVADAVAAAKTGAKIVVVGETNGADIDAGAFDLVLDGSTVGNVTSSKNVIVTSDSTAASIASAAALKVEAGAVLSVTETIPATLPIIIDASKGSGSRLVLDVDATKVTLDPANVTILGKDTYAARILDGTGAHAGDLYLVSKDNAFFAPVWYVEEEIDVPVLDDGGNPTYDDDGNPITKKEKTGNIIPTFADGDFDKASGDALFDGVNVFRDRETAVSTAKAANGVFVLVTGMASAAVGEKDVTTMFEVSTAYASGNSAIVGLQDGNDTYKSSDAHTVILNGSTNSANNNYGLARRYEVSGDFTLIVNNALQTGNDFWVTGNNVNNVMTGNINAEITGSTLHYFQIGNGSFGLDEDSPINVNVTVTGSTILNELRGFRLSEDANVKPVINANLNMTVLDSVVNGPIYALFTGDYRGDSNVTLRYSAYNSGSITVTLGGVSGINQIHGGDSLMHSRNALQNFNIPTTLHIVKGEKSARTTANWIMEWNTIIVDADAELYANNDIQFQSGDVNDARLPNSGRQGDGALQNFKINVAGYEGGTKQVMAANGNIYTNAAHSNFEIIGEDSTKAGRYELAIQNNGDNAKWVGVFDKAGDIYLNSGYNSGTSNTSINGQVLYYGYNAQSDADDAAAIVTEWDSNLIVTGGSFEDVDFASSVTVTGAEIVTLTGAGSDSDVSVTVNAKSAIGSIVAAEAAVAGDVNVAIEGALSAATNIDGAKELVAGKSVLDVKASNQLGDIANFDEVKLAKGADVMFGDVSDASLSVYADNSIYADSITLGSDLISIDVTGYTGGSRSLIVTQNGITDYAVSKVKLVGEGAADYSFIYAINAETNEGVLSLLSSVPTDVYLNSTYSDATTGTFYNGVYLTYGTNAFSTFATAAANVGEGYSVIMTGGEFADSITLDGVNFVLKSGTLGGLEVGTGASTLTVDGTAAITAGIDDFTGLTVSVESLFSTEYIDFAEGAKIRIIGSDFVNNYEAKNLRKVIDTETGIANVAQKDIVSDNSRFYGFIQNGDLFVLDKKHVYVDPTFTEAITGTTSAQGDHLVFGVNAFTNMNDAQTALVTGGTLFVANWGTAGSQAANIAPGKPASIVAQGPTNFSVIANGGTPQVINDDIMIVIDNVGGTPQASSRLLGTGGSAGNRWVFNGNVSITFKGTGGVNTNADFGISSFAVYNGDLLQINIEGKSIDTDYWFFRDVAASDFENLGVLELNITGMTTPNAAKWNGIFAGSPNLPNGLHVVANITDSVYIAGNNDWSIGLVQDNTDGSTGVIYDVYLSGTTINGDISGARTALWSGTVNTAAGNRTLHVQGADSVVAQATMFHHIVIDANSRLTVTNANNAGGQRGVHFLDANESGPNTLEIDVSDYTGADKMVLSASAFTGADFTFVLTGNTNDTYIGGLNKARGAYIITKNGDVLYNSAFTAADNGLAVGDTFVHMDGAVPANSNAFSNYDEAKTAFDAHETANPGRTLFVLGSGDDMFYADGYAVTVSGGTYENDVFGSARDGSAVDSVNVKISDGLFLKGIAASDGEGAVSGTATIEIAGGTFGSPAVYENPESEDPTKDEVAITISGSKDKVEGASTLILSKDLVKDTVKDGETVFTADIVGSVVDFDSVVVGKGVANMTIGHDLSATAITIDASSQLTVLGDLTTETITIDATEYVGPSKVIAVSDDFVGKAAAELPAVTINGDLEVYDYKYVEDTLYLVSKHAGNVYLNSTWNESISGTIYNGELLVWGVNAVNSMDDALLKITSDYTLYITGGKFDGTYTFGENTKIDMRDDATQIGGLVLGDGSSVKIAGVTSGVGSVGTITAVEGSTSGYSVVASSATAFGTIDGINAFTFTAGQNITVTGINYREDAASLTVDVTGYTQAADSVELLKGEITNFIKPVEGQEYSRTTVRLSGNTGDENLIMPYYDEEKKAVIGVKAGKLGMVVMPDDERNNNSINGTVVTIEGVTGTMVYGYNLNQTPETVATYIELGGTIYADKVVAIDGYTPYFFTNKPLNAVLKDCNISGLIVGYDNGDQYHGARYQSEGKTRYGAFTFLAENTQFNWYTNIAAYGYNNGTDDKCFQTLIVGDLVYDPENPEAEPVLEDAQYNIAINGCSNNCTLRIAEYAKISGGTVNVNIDNLTIGGEISLFRHAYNNGDEQLKEINVTLSNSRATAQRWIYVWDVNQSNSTNITLTITDTTISGSEDQSIGIFGACEGGSWDGEGTIIISGFTTSGRVSARGNGNGDNDHLQGLNGDIVLKVVGDSYVRVVREMSKLDIAEDALLTGAEIRLQEDSEIVLRGSTGSAREYAVVGTTVTGIPVENISYVDEEGYDIEGPYAAVIGSKSIFTYKTDGAVFYNNTFDESITGTAVTEADGTKNFLVFGDNAVSGMAAASASMDARTDATLFVEGFNGANFETRGYKTVFNGGRATTVWGGYNGSGEEAKDTVASANITVNSGATVTNIYAAGEKALVSGDVAITIGDGVSIGGTIDGAADYVAGDSFLTFEGTATVKGNVLGFADVSVDADEIVAIGGTVSNAAITIDTTGYQNATKIVMTSELGFDESVTVKAGEGFGYEFSADRKALMVVSDFVGDTFFNSDWTAESVDGLYVDGVKLVWNKNAFNTMNAAALAVGDGYSVIMDGGVSTDDVDLNGHDFVAGGTQVGKITSAGATLTVKDTLTAGGLSGFAAVNMSAKAITVTGAVALAENATLTIDATGYTQEADDVVLISAGEGITNLATANITVTGSTAFGAYVSEEDGNVHMVKLTSNRYFSTAYSEEATQGVKDPTTGEILFYGKNAFNTLTPALNSTVTGGTTFIYDRNGTVSPSGTDPKNLYLIGGTVTALRNMSGDRSAVQVNVPISLTVDGTFLAGDMEYILGRGNTWTSVGETLSYFQPVTVTMTGGTNTGNIRFAGQWSSILGNITLNLKDWTLLGDIKPFVGDVRTGSNDTGPSKIVWNWENVTLPDSKWIAIANVTDWGADKVGADGVSRQSMDAIEFTMKNSNLRGANARIAAILEDTAEDRVDSNTDITFTVEDSYVDALLTTTLTNNYTRSTFGVKTLNITGTSSFIQWANWFQVLNITSADTFLSGGTVTFQGSGVINVDATGYTGGSKVLVSLTKGFERTDTTKDVELNLTQDEGANYELIYGSKAVVLKSDIIENVYANSTYTADITGSVYAATGELLIFNSNAFDNMADALAVLPADGTIYVTGGSLEVATALPSNNLTIDADASLTYKGGVAITITDAFVNEGSLTISTEGFDLSGGKTLALSAASITGNGTYKATGDGRYLLSLEGNALYFTERKVDVYVNTEWAGLAANTTVDLLSGGTATIGIDAFATGEDALANVFGGGTITIEAGDVTFGTSKVACTVTALTGVSVNTMTIDAGGSLTVKEGASAVNMIVRKGGTLTVDAGATLTGTLNLGSESIVAVNGTFDFSLVNLSVGADALVNNLKLVGGAPTYTITVKDGQADGLYKLAGGATDFAITSPISVKTASGAELGTIDELGVAKNLGGILYTLSVTDGIMTLNRETYVAPIEITYVNSEWASLADGAIVNVAGGTAEIGYDAFAALKAAEAALTEPYDTVNVVGGTISFADGYTKSITVGATVTVLGTATFTKDITIDGTIAFDTANATATAAQFGGFSFVKGTATKYTLTDAAAAKGTYLLASGISTFTGDVVFGTYTLQVGADVQVGDLVYTLGITDNSELALTIAEYVPPVVVPTQTYANSEWTGLAADTIVSVAGGTAKIGYDAFATLADAISGVTEDGKVNVSGGTVSFADGYSKTITVDAGATVVGKATFDKAITVNGTFAFDTANATATAAQFGGFSFVSGTATYTLTDAAAAKGTYLLASGVTAFDSTVEFGTYTLQVGADVLVGDLVYTLGITDNNELALTIADKPVPPTPTYVAKSDVDANGISDVLFQYTGGEGQIGFWLNGTADWRSTNAPHPTDAWKVLGAYDMDGNGKADSVLVGDVEVAGVKGMFIGYYIDGIDAYDGSTWANISYLGTDGTITWQNKVGNLTGNANMNSIVWHSPSAGALGVWTDGTDNWVSLGGGYLAEGGWDLVGCGDFTGAGKDSIIMSYAGQVFYTVDIDGNFNTLTSTDAGWEIRAIGDFSGDGKDDIVAFHAATGLVAMWGDGDAQGQWSLLGQLDAEDWFVVGAGDYNNDQKDDLLVRQYSTGMLGYYSTGDMSQWVEMGRGVDMMWTVIA